MDNSDLVATADQVAQLQLRKEALLRETALVDVQLQFAKAKHSRLLNQTSSHIYKLPTEILSSIFLLCQQQPLKSAHTPFEVLASHVSNTWRNVAIGTPLLWTSLLVKVRPKQLLARRIVQWKLERVQTYLARSDACIFSATFDIAGPFQIDEILRLLATHAGRWRRLSISLKGPPSATLELWQALHALTVPALEHVSIWLARGLPIAGHIHPNDADCDELIFGGGAPSLKFARLSGMALVCLLPPLRLIETLHLSSCPLSYTSFRSLLGNIESLHNLSLHRMHITNHPSDATPITLPGLYSLRVCGIVEEDYPHVAATHYQNRLLRLLRVPVLEELVLKDLDGFEEQIFPNVHTLSLHSCPFPAGDMVRMLLSFPALTTFRLDESLPDILDLLGLPAGSSSPETPPWQKLHTLMVTNMEPADASLLCDMVEKRMETGTPLRRLGLDRRSRVVLRKKGKLDWLQTAVEVERHEGNYLWPANLGYEDNEDEGFWEP